MAAFTQSPIGFPFKKKEDEIDRIANINATKIGLKEGFII